MNPFDQFDKPTQTEPQANPFDRFDAPSGPVERPVVKLYQEPAPTPSQLAERAGVPIAYPYGISTTPTPAQAAAFLGTSASVVPVLAAGVTLGPEIATLSGMARLGLIGSLSKLTSESIYGRDVTSPEALGAAAESAVLSAYPGPAQGSRFLLGKEGGILKGLEALGMTALTTVAGEEAGRYIAGKPAKTLKEFKEDWRSIGIPSLFSAALYTGGTAMGRTADLVDEANARREILKSIGVKNPTLAALLGTERFGSIEAATAFTNPAISSQRDQMATDVNEYILKAFRRGTFASNEEVADIVNRNIKNVNELQDRFNEVEKNYVQAKDALDRASANMSIPDEQRQLIVQDATERVFSSLQEKAQVLMDQFATGGLGLVIKDKPAEMFSKVIGEMWELRGKIGKQLYAPLNKVGPAFTADDLANVAERALGQYATSEEGKRIVSSIRSYKGSGQTVEGVRLNPDAEFDPMAPRTLPAKTALDLEDVRQMRSYISDLIDGVKDLSVKNLERNASIAYNAINNRIGEVISGLPDGENLKKQWDTARDYWASSFAALETNSKGARALLRGKGDDPADIIDTIASELLNAKAGAVDTINQFVKSVSQNNPEATKTVLASLGYAVKNSILTQFRKPDGFVDWAIAAPKIRNMASLRGMQEIMPVETLGLGTFDQIDTWSRAVMDFKKRGLTNEAINAGLSDPRFQEALIAGATTGATDKASRRALAEQLFKQRVAEAEANITVGLTAEANRKYREAQAVANNFKIEKETADRLIGEAKKNPLIGEAGFAMFAGQAPLTRVPEATTGRLGDLILKQDSRVAKAWIDYLRKNDPATAEVLSGNVLANYLGEFISASKSGVTDLSRLRTSLTTRNGDYEKLSSVVGGEAFDKANRLVSSLPIIDDIVNAKAVSDSSVKRLADIFGITLGVVKAVPAGQLPREQFAQRRFVQRVGDLVANDMYSTLSVWLTDPKRLQILSTARDFSDAVSKLPTQQALSLMYNERLVNENARYEAKKSQPTR